MGQEERRAQRVPAFITVYCDLGVRRCYARSLDISWHGLGLVSSQPIPLGALVRLPAPGGGKEVWAEACWSAPAGEEHRTGLRFCDGPQAPSQDWVRSALSHAGLLESALRPRRRCPRVPCNLLVRVGEETVALRDLNRLGACAVSDRPLPERCLVELGELRLETRVVNRRGRTHHLQWEGLTPEQSRQLGLETARLARLSVGGQA